MKELRLLPLVIVAIGALLTLKGIGLVFGEAQIFGGTGPAMAQEAEDAAEAGETEDAAADMAEDAAAMAPEEGQAEPAGEADDQMAADGEAQEEPTFLERVMNGNSRSRDALLESLAERRKELEARDEELDLRENLLKAAEQRLEQRIAELKEIEARISVAEEERKTQEIERVKGLVTMYENMKPKDAARIFNRLDMPVVVKIASLMSAQQMSLVLAEMDSEVAQRLTIEMSADPEETPMAPGGGGELPKIVGTRPAN